jgi:hypothetical protein
VAERLDARGALLGVEAETGPSVRLTDFDPDGEIKLAASALFAHSEVSDSALLEAARSMTVEERRAVIADLIGDRENRRHKPGRPMERTTYRFDVVCDFGAFRDLQRHRLMTIEWQRLSTRLGFDTPPDILEAGHGDAWAEAMERSTAMYERVRDTHGPDVAQYVVPFAANIRFVMDMNARQAYHLIELRSQPAGHTAYRRVAHEMHRLIAEVAGHTAIAGGMTFVDHSDVDLERLEAERAAEKRRKLSPGRLSPPRLLASGHGRTRRRRTHQPLQDQGGGRQGPPTPAGRRRREAQVHRPGRNRLHGLLLGRQRQMVGRRRPPGASHPAEQLNEKP